MATNKKLSKATQRWISLPKNVQLEVLQKVWAEQSAAIRQEYPNVASVGLGYKAVNGVLQPYMSLAFLVDKKSSNGAQLPTAIKTSVLHEGKRLPVSIPTDVEEFGDSGPQLSYDASGGVIVRSVQVPGKAAGGAVCCLVKVDGKRGLHMLSCHHVLTLAEHVGACRAASNVTVFTPDGNRIGVLVENASLTPGAASQVDAAIALIDDGTDVTWRHSGMQPRSVNMGEAEPPRDCTVYAPDGSLISAKYNKTFPDTHIEFPNCGVIRIDCYKFDAKTRRGDSGSPIISEDGTLQAMHFWGDNGGTFSLAIPAGYLFSPGLFSGELILA